MLPVVAVQPGEPGFDAEFAGHDAHTAEPTVLYVLAGHEEQLTGTIYTNPLPVLYPAANVPGAVPSCAVFHVVYCVAANPFAPLFAS